METRGSLGPHGQSEVLKLTPLQSVGSNTRLEIAKVAQKSFFHFVMGVLITPDQCVSHEYQLLVICFYYYQGFLSQSW